MTERRARTIRVDALGRVEGEGALFLRLAGDRVTDVKLRIYEPPRLFEELLRGRHLSEVPDIVARICGICPVAYQMSAVGAIERALGVRIDPAVALLRRLLYCGEWIESHALHLYFLHLPDFLGYPDAITLARDHPAVIERALRLKKIGNRVMQVLGGREIHPISVAVGGFHKVPTRHEVAALAPDLEWALTAARETVGLTASLAFPDFEQEYELVALRHPREYPILEGRLASSGGLDIDACQYEDHFVERQVEHSTALHSSIRGRGAYLVGPLARFNLSFERLPEAARAAALEAGLRPPVRNPFRSIEVRAVEIVFACEEALRLVREYEPPAAPRVEVPTRAAVGHAITEAPRGILYHRYELDDRGKVVTARIVPPTSQNLRRIEEDLREYAARFVAVPLEEATWRCEQAVRNHDPCISCATHFLRAEADPRWPAGG